MADDTTVIPDSGYTPEPVPDTIADIELNGFNPAEESTDTEQVEDVQEETSDDQTADKPAEEPEDEPETEETTEAVQPQEQPKAQEQPAHQSFKQRQQQRDYIAEQRAQVNAYQQELQTKARTEGLDELEELKETQRIIQANQYIDRVERSRTQLVSDNMRAQQDIDLFNPSKPNFNETLYQRALDRFNESYVVTDQETGEVLGAEDRRGNPVSMYTYLQQEAAAIQDVLGSTQRQVQRSESKMRSRAVNPSNPGKVTSSGNEDDDLFERIKDVPLAG